MNNKTIIVLVGLALIISYLGFKVMSLSASENRNAQISLTTDPNPPRLGSNIFIIDVKDEKSQPVNNATVSFDLNMTTMNMGTQQGTATSQGNGRYTAEGKFTMLGPWRLSTKVSSPDGKSWSKDFDITVQR